MTLLQSSLGIIACLVFGLVVTLAGRWFDCVVRLEFGNLSGFASHEAIRAECVDRFFFFL